MVFVILMGIPARASEAQIEGPPESFDEYLENPAVEVALARSAAPSRVSQQASVMVLGRGGYRVVDRGTNGFVCLVQRSWNFPPNPQSWNPRVRTPVCHNPEGASSVLQIYLRKTELVMNGASIEAAQAAVDAEVEAGRLRYPKSWAMSYMMSSGTVLYEGFPRMSHLMVYTPYASNAEWGGNRIFGDAPFVLREKTQSAVAIVPMPNWVDPELPGHTD